ncbi:hypothetical protein [Sorangium sp. So ce1000]|uniref:hypothetical protein n=1 Tax=Sorangium sp. So ce1000 TaxID=3133325 RepID=UPI003F644831
MRGLLWSTAALALALAGCSKPTPLGELMLILQTDMAAPKDLDHLELHVVSEGKPEPIMDNERFALGPDGFLLPATQALLVSDDPSREITIRVRAISRDWTRMEHTVVTTVPEDRTAALWVPIHFLCSGDATENTRSPVRCTDRETCVAGECRPRDVSSADLPDYSPHDILTGSCFDVARCFDNAAAASIALDTCTIGATGDVNVAISTEGEGACGPSGCFVPLDAESAFGWRRRGDRIELPKALCSQGESGRLARLGVVTSPVTADCPLKQIGDTLCEVVDETRPVVVAARQRNPSSLAVSDDSVFWTEQGSLGDPADAVADGAVKRIALGGGAPLTLASAQALPRQIALDAKHDQILWTNHGVGGIPTALMRRSLDDDDVDFLLDAPSRAALESSGALEGLATDGRHAFWTQLRGAPGGAAPGRVGRRALDGAMEMDFVDATSANYIAAANDVVCWTELGEEAGTGGNGPQGGRGCNGSNDGGTDDRGSVWCLKHGDTVAVNVGARQRDPHGIALDAKAPTEVFWVSFGGEVVRGAVDGSRCDVIFQDHANRGLLGVALDERWVYWTNRIGGTVSRLPRDAAPVSEGGGEPPITLVSGQRSPGAIAVHAGSVYWINEGSTYGIDEGAAPDGAVVRRKLPLP